MSGQTPGGTRLTRVQKVVLTAAFVPMLATGIAGGIGTYSNIESAYGSGTAMGAVAAGEGATAVLALVLLGLTLLGQSSPAVVRAGLWLLPAAASAMSLTAAEDPGQMIVYAITPMGMTVAAEGMAFLARRIVVHQNGGRDVEADARAAAVVQELAYHRARATSHPDTRKRKASERRAWKLARRVGRDDPALAGRLLTIQRDRLQSGADAALAAMFGGTPTTPTEVPTGVPVLPVTTPLPAVEAAPVDAIANAEESTRTTAKWSPPGLPEQPSVPGAGSESVAPPVGPDSESGSASVAPDSPPRPLVAAADRPRPSRVTTPVPPSATRTAVPRRSWDQLLTDARTVTDGWSDEALTANAIRQAVRTSADNARKLREALRAERAERVSAA
ncbi:conjugal transfer protein [Streptomyces sp. ST2-7A]|uniref:conjugal transfer protein n=1 Tax=Streptomyces sp. ST2-7A TaxID=2907214 RepID=UPI001F1FE582|nr:conjugal transfer protein [Streptomyces sp. ST2-7A]MCE7081586.1 conjugal transfer protein [Streptomyces sp. ST2-7A]